jgi:hypothetical protein
VQTAILEELNTPNNAANGFKSLQDARNNILAGFRQFTVTDMSGNVSWTSTPTELKGYIAPGRPGAVPPEEVVVGAKLHYWWVSGMLGPSTRGVMGSDGKVNNNIAEMYGFAIDEDGRQFIIPDKAIAPEAVGVPPEMRTIPDYDMAQMKTLWNASKETINKYFVAQYGVSPSKNAVFPPDTATQKPLWKYNGTKWVKTKLGNKSKWNDVVRALVPPKP